MSTGDDGGKAEEAFEETIAAIGLRQVTAYLRESRARSKAAEGNARRQASYRSKKEDELKQLRDRVKHMQENWRPIAAMSLDQLREASRMENAERLGRKVLALSGWRKRVVFSLLD